MREELKFEAIGKTKSAPLENGGSSNTAKKSADQLHKSAADGMSSESP